MRIFRHIRRNGFYSLINILGLAPGLACFFLIALFVKDELSYDKFNNAHQSIYRVIGILDLEGQGEQSSSCPFPVGPALANDYPQLIEHTVRFFNFQDPQHTLRVAETKINESRLFFVDSNVFSVFDFPLDEGNRQQVLSAPNTIVITRAMARKYFGDQAAIGKMIKYDGVLDLMVTGILGDLPTQSHIHFDALISFSTLRNVMGNQQKSWVWNPNWTYVKLKPGVQARQLEAEFPSFVKKYYPDFLKPQVRHLLQPLDDIHLNSKYAYEIEANGDGSLVRIFSLIGIFILCIACINFVNLATARAAERSMETGIRKVAGAGRSQLILLYLSESFAMVSVAVFISLIIAILSLPAFNRMADKALTASVFTEPFTLVLIIVVTIVTTILSSLYPAFRLSSYRPAQVMQSRRLTGKSNTGLRKALVILQFTIGIILMNGTGVVMLQLHHMRSAQLGFDSGDRIVLPVRPPMARIFESLINDLKARKDVLHVATMNDVIGKHHNTHEYNYKGMQPGKWIYFPSLLINEEFVSAMNMKIIAGRDFSKAFPRDDSLSVIVNEAMVRHMHWANPEAAIGKQFYTPTGHERIIGVVKDFHFESLHTPLGPFVLDIPHKKDKIYWTRYIIVQFKKGNKPAISGIETLWNRYSTEFPFEYFYLEDDLRKQYRAEENTATLIAVFSILAIIIACLGLLALAAYSTSLRTKEIAIRKVMGAGNGTIILMLSKYFMRLILISIALSGIISRWLMNEWLKGFAFRTEFPFYLHIISGTAALMIAWLALAYHAVKAANAPPSKFLRYE